MCDRKANLMVASDAAWPGGGVSPGAHVCSMLLWCSRPRSDSFLDHPNKHYWAELTCGVQLRGRGAGGVHFKLSRAPSGAWKCAHLTSRGREHGLWPLRVSSQTSSQNVKEILMWLRSARLPSGKASSATETSLQTPPRTLSYSQPCLPRSIHYRVRSRPCDAGATELRPSSRSLIVQEAIEVSM